MVPGIGRAVSRDVAAPASGRSRLSVASVTTKRHSMTTSRSAALVLLLLAPRCATTTVESRVTDPAAIAEARAADQATDPASATVVIVVLRLRIGADGFVRDAQVVESAGTKADETAVRAAYRLHFNPAQKDGQPVESTIRFAFTVSPES
jgi:TonB family protein